MMTMVDPFGPTFVSHRQSDGADLAVDLAWAMRAAGVPVWHDRTDLLPGDTSERLQEALSSGLSGAVLIVTPQIAASNVVREIELPALLQLATNPTFTLSIVSTITTDSSGSLDYLAPDRLLGTPEGTLSAFNQMLASTPTHRVEVARALARRRLELLRDDIAKAAGQLMIDLQTRIPPFAARHEAHLVVRLRPPADGQRRPHIRGLQDLEHFSGSFRSSSASVVRPASKFVAALICPSPARSAPPCRPPCSAPLRSSTPPAYPGGSTAKPQLSARSPCSTHFTLMDPAPDADPSSSMSTCCHSAATEPSSIWFRPTRLPVSYTCAPSPTACWTPVAPANWWVR